MESEDTTSFWKWWKSIYGNGKCQNASVVDGMSSKEGIARAFQTAFQENAKPNNPERVEKNTIAMFVLDYWRDCTKTKLPWDKSMLEHVVKQ